MEKKKEDMVQIQDVDQITPKKIVTISYLKTKNTK